MEHSCHRCHASLEEGIPFCPHCGAPQIRVTGPSSDTPATPPFPPDTPEEIQPPAQPVALEEPAPRVVQWRAGFRSSALAGLLLAVAVFFVPAFVAAVGLGLHLGEASIGLLVVVTSWFCMALGGALAVFFYRRRLPAREISRGMGARLGVVAGLLGFFLYAVPQAIRLAFFHLGASLRDAVRRAIEHSAAQNPDPNAQEIMRNLLTPQALAVFLAVLGVLFFLVFLFFSTIGGAIGASFWGSRDS